MDTDVLRAEKYGPRHTEGGESSGDQNVLRLDCSETKLKINSTTVTFTAPRQNLHPRPVKSITKTVERRFRQCPFMGTDFLDVKIVSFLFRTQMPSATKSSFLDG